ncbi:MAG: phosphatase PAP2 family protein [Bacteroidetes bacterium]|nr:phosphatase PAP2 family protein [Bacteroidota bacterium]
MINPIKKYNSIRRVIVTHLIINLLTVSLFGQVTDFKNYPYKPDKDYISSYWTTTKKIAVGPLHWKQKEWIIAGTVAAAGITLYIFDDEIRQVFQNNKSNTLDFASKYITEPWGSGLYPAALFGGYYIYGLASQNERARQIALGGTQAFVMAGISSQVLKQIFHRHRPSQDIPSSPYLWEGPFKGWDNTAFPSGHTTAAFAIASMMSKVYKDKIWVGILSYSLATGVGLSRVYDNVHWPTDVLIGAALGYAIGQSVYSIMSNDSKFTMGISETGGVSVAYRIE